jgi:prolyl-tRNA synthetase
MRASQFFISTLKEAPADAEVASQQLMLRAGFIKKLAAGIYTYMPMGLRSIRKIEAIIRDEMNRAGAIELLMPVIQPAELWQESGRWDKYGPELLRIKDRHQRDFIVQPTSEEVIADIVRQEIRSYRQLPVNFYHIQTKFRDERRPRFGVMRGREFTMKDAYSFDRDVEGAMRSYDAMYRAYCRIFERMGLRYRAVAADMGAIGGEASHEFQVIADTGEDAIVYCPSSDFAANIELAEALPLIDERAPAREPMLKVPTPGRSTCEQVAELLGMPLERTVKSLVLATEDRSDAAEASRVRLWLLLVRGDHELNEVKAGKIDGLRQGWRFATATEIVDHFGCEPGYLGPIGLRKPVTVVADRTVARMSDFVCGANEADAHLRGVNWGRDLPEPELVVDIRNVRPGDPSPDGKGVLEVQRGIEVGHVFAKLPYVRDMNVTFLDENGEKRHPVMGCYGIGVTRILGAAIEQNHDAKGIVWPPSIAPFELVLCGLGAERSAAVRETCENLYRELQQAGVDVIWDDRGLRPGAMFADWELIGVPLRLVVSERGLSAGQVELQHRRATQATLCSPSEATARAREMLAAVQAGAHGAAP